MFNCPHMSFFVVDNDFHFILLVRCTLERCILCKKDTYILWRFGGTQILGLEALSIKCTQFTVSWINYKNTSAIARAWFLGNCIIICDLYAERNHKIFRGHDTPSLYASSRKFDTFVFILLKIDAPQSSPRCWLWIWYYSKKHSQL